MKAVFLDRDGTLIKAFPGKPPLLTGRPANTPDEVELCQGVAEGIRKLKQAGFLLCVVTNQGGIELGYATSDSVKAINERMNDLLILAGAQALDAIIWCPHYNATCQCRKPKPGMILELAKDLAIDLPNSYIVGDDGKDMQAGRVAGVRKCVQVISDRYDPEHYQHADVAFASFDRAANYIVAVDAML